MLVLLAGEWFYPRVGGLQRAGMVAQVLLFLAIDVEKGVYALTLL